jgi:hypothetical protein
MKNIQSRSLYSLTAGVILLTFLGAVQPTDPNPNSPVQENSSQKYFVTLKDFTQEEVKGIGFTVDKETAIHINAIGGGSKNAWKDVWGDKRRGDDMFAAGWIINADTREMVWEMTMENTSGKEDERSCEKEIKLKPGSYEVYFEAYGYVSSSAFNYNSINIDRRNGKNTGDRFVEKFLGWFGEDDYRSMYNNFMGRAKDKWGIMLSVANGDNSGIRTFNAPKKNSNIVFSATGVGDGAFVRKKITVNKDVALRIYALGEGRGRDEVFDYGWIVNTDTRERVWGMTHSNTDYAGGASKNILYDGDVRLSKGSYELNFVTDDSHSREDWNSKPPFDPFNYGVTLFVKNESEKSAISVSDYNFEKGNIIVQLTRARDEDYLESGFSLKAESKLHIYAIGEADHGDGLADYGWITNAKTRERVWEMELRNTTHAGGAKKNRLADEFITLPKGDYVVYFQTDDSHAYNDWNDDKPYDAESYGITVMGAGDSFSQGTVTKYTDNDAENAIVQLIRVRSDRHVRQKFTIDKPMKVRVYSIGEGVGNEMSDYAWIENVKNGDVVWEMTYRTTSNAGGAKKNRLFDKSIFLEKGEYEVHYQTDDSHAFNDWNDDPPNDRTHWGVTIYKEQ